MVVKKVCFPWEKMCYATLIVPPNRSNSLGRRRQVEMELPKLKKLNALGLPLLGWVHMSAICACSFSSRTKMFHLYLKTNG